MKISTKIAFIVSIVSLVLFLSGGIFMGLFFFDMLDRQETQDIANKRRNIVNYLQDQATTLSSTLNDWAKWDDTYDFVNNRDPQYIDLNLTGESVSHLNVSFIAYYDRTGGEIHRLYYDAGAMDLAAFPEDLHGVLGRDMAAVYQKGMQFDDSTGVLFCGGDAYLYARTSIMDSTVTSAPAGVLCFGRKVDRTMTKKMLNLAGGIVSIVKRSELEPSVDAALLSETPGPDGIRSVTVKNGNKSLATYTPIELNGIQTGSVLVVRDRRLIYQAGLIQHNIMMGLFFAISIIVLAVMTVLLHCFIAKPITALIRSISRIIPSAGTAKRLEVKGNHELAQLSRSINGMMDKIEDSFHEIKTSKEQFRSLAGEMKQGFAVHGVKLDADGKPEDLTYVYANDSFKAITGLDSGDIAERSMRELFPQTAEYWIEKLGSVALRGEPLNPESFVTTSGRCVEMYAYRPQPMQCALLMSDITERQKASRELEYMSYHDQLTGLYNRRYFEEALRRLDTPENLPLSIVIGDLNGLKFTNDAFGHQTGDRMLATVAEALAGICRPRDIVARWGGDEFTLLLPGTSGAEAGEVCAQIRQSVASIEINSMRCSISMGYDTKTRKSENIRALLKSAEDYMYRSRMKEDVSGRGNAIQAIMTTFQERNEREKEHSMRVSRLCRLIAEAMGLPYEQATDMEIAGLVHDIGKIAISDAIINKKGKLTADEWEEMKRHPEIGWRILSASSEMLVIAQYVLTHHERWDGSGYPKGIAGKEIPLQARILAVADSYDAITSMRPYKLRMEVKDAVAELKRCSGKLFDPDVVKAFVENVLGYPCGDEASGKAAKAG